MGIRITTLAKAFENAFYRYKLYLSHDDIVKMGEPGNTSDFVYEACVNNDIYSCLYFTCKAITRMYDVDLDKEVFFGIDDKTDLWYPYITTSESQKAIEFLQEVGEDDPFSYRYLRWLHRHCHYEKWKTPVIVKPHLYNYPPEFRPMHDNMEQNIVFALYGDPIALERIIELIGPKAENPNNVCTVLYDRIKEMVLLMETHKKPRGMWALQRAIQKGFRINETTKKPLYKGDCPWKDDLRIAAKNGYPPAMLEYAHYLMATIEYDAKIEFDQNRESNLGDSAFRESAILIDVCRDNGYLDDKNYQKEKNWLLGEKEYLRGLDSIVEEYVSNGYMTNEEVREAKKKEMKEFKEKMDERERFANLLDFGSSVLDSELKSKADYNDYSNASRYFEERMQMSKEIEDMKQKEIDAKYDKGGQ